MDLMAPSESRFQPWHAALRALGESPSLRWQCSTGAEPSIVWVSSSNGNATIADDIPLERVCEALSLLALLFRVDVSAWKNAVTTIWPSQQVGEWVNKHHLPSSLSTAFAMGLDISEPKSADLSAMRRIYDSNTLLVTRNSTEYQELRAELELTLVNKETQTAGSWSHAKVPVRIDLSSAMRSFRDTTALLRQAVQLIKSQHIAPSSSSSRSTRRRYAPKFTVAEVNTMTANYVMLDERGLMYLSQIAEHGIHVTSLQALYLTAYQQLRGASIKALRSLLSLDGHSTPGVRSVLISNNYASQVVPKLLSAVQDSPAVHTLRIVLGEDGDDSDEDEQRGVRRVDDRQAWAELAYHVFRSHARHNIQTLELYLTDLQITEVEAVRIMLTTTAKNPLAKLYHHQDNTIVSVPTLISASRFSLQAPELRTSSMMMYAMFNNGRTRETFFQTPQPVTVQVIASPGGESASWTVLLPGYGKAWVLREDVLRVHDTVEPPSVCAKTKIFPHIQIASMSDESTDAVVDLLELIGQGTAHLSVHKCRTGYSMDAWCRQVLGVCPSLRRLELHRVPLESLQVFVDAAVAGRCRLRELLAKQVRTGDWSHIRVFLGALSDPSHPVAAHLRVVDLRFIVENVNVGGVIELLRQLLQRNRQLITIHLTFKVSDLLRSIQGELELAFAHEVEERVWIRSAPLDNRSKFALLSVLDKESSRAFGCVDATVIGIVFQFAAQGHARSFRLTFQSEESAVDPEEE